MHAHMHARMRRPFPPTWLALYAPACSHCCAGVQVAQRAVWVRQLAAARCGRGGAALHGGGSRGLGARRRLTDTRRCAGGALLPGPGVPQPAPLHDPPAVSCKWRGSTPGCGPCGTASPRRAPSPCRAATQWRRPRPFWLPPAAALVRCMPRTRVAAPAALPARGAGVSWSGANNLAGTRARRRMGSQGATCKARRVARPWRGACSSAPAWRGRSC